MSKNKAPEPNKIELKKPDQKNDPKKQLQVKKQTETQKYFKQLSGKVASFEKIAKQAEKGEKSVIKSIKKGKIEVKEVPHNINDLLIQEEINHQQLKAVQLQRKRQQIIDAIERLDMRRQVSTQSLKTIAKKYSNPDMLKYNPNAVLTKEEHENLVEKIRQAQSIQDQRNQERLYHLQKKLQQDIEKEKKLSEQKQNQQKQLRRRRSQYKLSVRKQINDLQNAEEQRSRKQIRQIGKKSHLHQILQEKFNKAVVIPSLEQKKRKLKQIRQFSKSFKIKDINEHQQKYLKQRNKSMQLFQSKSKVSEQFIYKAPQKTEKLTKILEEEHLAKKSQLQKEQRAIQQKILRHENYIKLLKQKHAPKIDPNKQQQIVTRIEKIHTKRKQIKESPRQFGMKYLSEAKKLKKYESEPEFKAEQQVVEGTTAIQSSRINYLTRKQDNQYYNEKRNQLISKIISADEDKTEKAHRLELENKKIEQACKRKQELIKVKGNSFQTRNDVANLLLSGIQAKMGLMKLAN